MKLKESQKELLNEILATANYINVYQEIETLLKKGEQPNWGEIENKYKITARQCFNILMEVKKDIIQEELANKIGIENKTRTEQRKLDENYIEILKDIAMEIITKSTRRL